jgi:hypothetical protein
MACRHVPAYWLSLITLSTAHSTAQTFSHVTVKLPACLPSVLCEPVVNKVAAEVRCGTASSFKLAYQKVQTVNVILIIL